MGKQLKTKIKDLNPSTRGLSVRASLLYSEYKNLLMNAIKISNVSFDTETLIKDCLIENGVVGYDALTDKWANVYGQGLNEMGNPTTLTFIFKNGKSFTKSASYEAEAGGSYRIKALPNMLALGTIIADAVGFIASCDEAIAQNVDACKTPFIGVCKDKDILLSIKQAIQQKEQGEPVLIVSEDIGEALKGVTTATEFIADRYELLRDMERDKLLNKLGIMSANINKRERVQVGEVNATVGQCSDYIYMLIDTFNKQMESYGLDFEMSLNGSLEELYEGETSGEYSDDNVEREVIENDKS